MTLLACEMNAVIQQFEHFFSFPNNKVIDLEQGGAAMSYAHEYLW